MIIDFYKTSRYINSKLRAKLRRTECIFGMGYPNLWCEVLYRMQDGFGDADELWDDFLIGEIVEIINNRFNDDEKFQLWYQTKYSESYVDSLAEKNIEFEWKLEQFSKALYFKLGDCEEEELGRAFLEEFYFEDIYDSDQEELKGRYIKIKHFLFKKGNRIFHRTDNLSTGRAGS